MDNEGSRAERFIWEAEDIEVIFPTKFEGTTDLSEYLLGGSGSGHHGHKGIPGQVGGSLPGSSSVAGSGVPSFQTVSLVGKTDEAKKLAKELDDWDGDRQAIGLAVIAEGMYEGDVLLLKDGEETMGMALLGNKNFRGKEYVEIEYLATKRPGYGRKAMEHIRTTATNRGVGVRLKSVPEAEGFYEKLGMVVARRVPNHTTVFVWEM